MLLSRTTKFGKIAEIIRSRDMKFLKEKREAARKGIYHPQHDFANPVNYLWHENTSLPWWREGGLQLVQMMKYSQTSFCFAKACFFPSALVKPVMYTKMTYTAC